MRRGQYLQCIQGKNVAYFVTACNARVLVRMKGSSMLKWRSRFMHTRKNIVIDSRDLKKGSLIFMNTVAKHMYRKTLVCNANSVFRCTYDYYIVRSLLLTLDRLMTKRSVTDILCITGRNTISEHIMHTRP